MQNSKPKVDRGMYAMIIMLVAIATPVLVYDIWSIVTGHVDLNAHLPILIPGVLYAFAYGIWYTFGPNAPRLTPEQRERLERENWDESCLNPKNTGRGHDDDIG